MLLPKDAADEKNAILEIRAGTGGDEAALFAADLFRMYQRYAAEHGWRFEVMELSDTGIGGYKEAIATISGRGVFARLKFESGVHRVQRVPATEAQGRIHTSAATVRCCPRPRNSTSRSTKGPAHRRLPLLRRRAASRSTRRIGGAHHPHPDRRGREPAGREEPAQEPRQGDEDPARPPLRRRAPAPRRCQAPPTARARSAAAIAASASAPTISRKSRVTDHRINLTLYKLDEVMEGGALDEFIDALIADDQAGRLAELAA